MEGSEGCEKRRGKREGEGKERREEEESEGRERDIKRDQGEEVKGEEGRGATCMNINFRIVVQICKKSNPHISVDSSSLNCNIASTPLDVLQHHDSRAPPTWGHHNKLTCVCVRV